MEKYHQDYEAWKKKYNIEDSSDKASKSKNKHDD